MKYVKKPVVIEAFQFGVDETPHWAFVTKHGEDADSYSYIKIPMGELWVMGGDMVIRKSQGNHFTCKKDIFDASYEEYQEPFEYIQDIFDGGQ